MPEKTVGLECQETVTAYLDSLWWEIIFQQMSCLLNVFKRLNPGYGVTEIGAPNMTLTKPTDYSEKKTKKQ